MRDCLLLFMIQIRGTMLIPFYWGGLLLGWNWDLTVLAGNQICDVKTEIRGRRGRKRMSGIIVTTNWDGGVVDYIATATIQLAVVRGSL
jgi:hypothetical protein